MSNDITENEAQSAEGKEPATEQKEREWAQGQFPVAALRLHRFKYCSAKTTLHTGLWISLREPQVLALLGWIKRPIQGA